jgi:hypothetical protein
MMGRRVRLKPSTKPERHGCPGGKNVATLDEYAYLLYRYFPKLAKGNHRIKSPFDPTYNCVAFAAGLRVWKEPSVDQFGVAGHWDEDLQKEDSLARTIRYFQQKLGYKVTRSARYEPGHEKIAIYADDKNEFKHVAKQSRSNWVSKLGQLSRYRT